MNRGVKESGEQPRSEADGPPCCIALCRASAGPGQRHPNRRHAHEKKHAVAGFHPLQVGGADAGAVLGRHPEGAQHSNGESRTESQAEGRGHLRYLS